MTKPYRKNVAVIIIRAGGEILACERSDVAGAWQLPQGGIEAGEQPHDAMLRELEEEIGTNRVRVIDALSEPIRYDWPDHLVHRGYAGQEQYYFLVELEDDAVVDVVSASSAEFSATEWLGVEIFLSRVSGFKANAYREALEKFSALHPTRFAARAAEARAERADD